MAKKKTSKKAQGFKANQERIARKLMSSEGISRDAAMERAGKILASSSRKASPAAKRRNPRLKKVKGKK